MIRSYGKYFLNSKQMLRDYQDIEKKRSVSKKNAVPGSKFQVPS
jgi:hypothetical protein